jgi:hypothetical protein
VNSLFIYRCKPLRTKPLAVYQQLISHASILAEAGGRFGCMRQTNTLKTITLTLLILFVAAHVHAAGARHGWTKLELSHADGRYAPIPSALLRQFGAELIGDYGAYTIVYVPKGIVTALEAQARNDDIRVRGRDDLDVLHLPGAAVDAREGISGVPADKLFREYPPGRPGVYVLQFIGPPRNEWIPPLEALGWRLLSRYVPNNGYLVVGTPELIGKSRQLPFVQWLDFFHPYQKGAVLARDGRVHDLEFVLAEGPGSEPAIEAIRVAAEGTIDVQRTSYDTRVYARMSDAAAEALLRHELILSVSPKVGDQISDERQVMSLTSNLNALQSAPTSPTGYWSWVTARCPECGTMSPSVWKVGLADTGLDDGLTGFVGHNDLWNRKFYGATFVGNDPDCPPDQSKCDSESHGTLVSGIIAGNGLAGTAFRDTNGTGYFLGQGVAQTAGIFSTKIFRRGLSGGTLFQYGFDAAVAGVTIQNHSFNHYAAPQAGTYNTRARDYDIATRDADGTINFTRIPMLFTVSSGNNNQIQPGGDTLRMDLTLPGATAKNTLSVGGLENYRPTDPECTGAQAEDFRNIMSRSRLDTRTSGWIKPDLMAPGSQIVSAATSIHWPNASERCLGAFEDHIEYTGDTGTSFSAPVAAGAAILVKRYLGLSPADVSPALTRAVLVAGARSVRGGWDRTKNPAQPVLALPNAQQGFGRVSLEDILNGDQKPIVFDQAAGDRTFTTAGQSWSTVVSVRDASKPVKIALVWTDTPAMENTPLPLVNDLNLEVRRSSNPYVVYVGNSLEVLSGTVGEESKAWPSTGGLPYDDKNTIELARLFLSAGEEFTVTVRAQAINGDTNESGSTFEQDFALAILNAESTCVPTTIVQHPQNQTVTPGSTAVVSVVPGGTGPFLYQWYEGPTGTFTTPLCGGATASCTVGPLMTTKQYWVRVRGACGGAVYSNAGTVTVQCTAAPSITAQPTSRTINYGASTTLGVSATQAVSYQWYVGSSPSTASPISGATGPTLTVAPTSTTSYWARVTNGCGIANSVTATVCVRPLITAHPTPRTINPGQSTTLTVSAVNATAYQWYQGTAPSTTTPVGTNSSSLTVSPIVTTNYWVRVLNSCSSVDSTTATVTVAPPPPPQITKIQTSFALANSQTSITGFWPQPTQPGTLLVAVISGRKDPNGLIVWTPPAGWVHANTAEWTNIIASIYYIPNNAGARTSETFTVAQGFHDQTLYLFEYSGMMAVNPLDKIAVNGDDTNSGFVQTGFTANTVQPKELVITVLSTYTPTEFSTVPADGYTEVYDKFIGNRLTTAAWTKITTAIGSYGHNATVGSPAQWIGLVATFRGADTN